MSFATMALVGALLMQPAALTSQATWVGVTSGQAYTNSEHDIYLIGLIAPGVHTLEVEMSYDPDVMHITSFEIPLVLQYNCTTVMHNKRQTASIKYEVTCVMPLRDFATTPAQPQLVHLLTANAEIDGDPGDVSPFNLFSGSANVGPVRLRDGTFRIPPSVFP